MTVVAGTHNGRVLPPLDVGLALTTLVADPFGLLVALGLGAGYAACVLRVRRQGGSWPVLRTVAFFVLGIGTLVVATCGALAAYRGVLFWAAGAQATVLSAVTPIGLALGDPVGLVRAALGPSSAARLKRLLRGRFAQVLMFPLVSSVVAVGTLIVVFFTGYYAASVRHLWVQELLYLHLLGTGSLFVLPLLGEEMLPAWCTHPVRALIAFADGLLDAAPGILVMTSPKVLGVGIGGLFSRPWGPLPAVDQRLAGGTMIVIAELIGMPFLAAVFMVWMRADDAEARDFDRAEDLVAARAVKAPTAPGSATAGGSAETAPDRPWWESDPRFADRYRR